MSETCYITQEQCEKLRREQKADWQRADDMLVDEMRGLRCEFVRYGETVNEFGNTITKIVTTQSEREKARLDKNESRHKRNNQILCILGIIATIIAAFIGAGYFT